MARVLVPGEGQAMSGHQHLDAASVAESHTAIVVFIADRAYKVKKPVDFGFLDFSTVASREAACRCEIELNRRLAPDVYLGVMHVVDDQQRICDWMVVMRRMPPERRLSALVQQNVDVSRYLSQLARILASFHSTAETGPEINRAGQPDRLWQRWSDNLAGVQAYVGTVLDHDCVAEITRVALQYVEGQAALFRERVSRSLIVDGHGDLQAEDIFCLPESPQVLDCLEFDPELRHVDAIDDAAFLAMDLERLGAPELAGQFLEWYREFSATRTPPTLVHHYLAYRAFVRAKVACLRWEQGSPDSATEARQLAGIALKHGRAARVRMVLVGGLPATGKSTIAAGLADQLGAVLLRTDQIRQESTPRPDSAGTVGYHQGRYAPEHIHNTYQEMLARARALSERGEHVVLDASWSSAMERTNARAVGDDTYATISELRCVAPAAITAPRLRNRRDDPSEATVDIASQMQTDFDSWPQADMIDTSGLPSETMTAAWTVVQNHRG